MARRQSGGERRRGERRDVRDRHRGRPLPPVGPDGRDPRDPRRRRGPDGPPPINRRIEERNIRDQRRKEQEFEDRVKRREELENKRAKPIAKKKKKGISKKIRTRHQGKRISDVPLKDLKSEVKGRIVRRVKKAKKDLGNTTLRKISKKIREAHIPPGMRKKKDKKKIAMKLGGFHTGSGSFIQSGAASLDD